MFTPTAQSLIVKVIWNVEVSTIQSTITSDPTLLQELQSFARPLIDAELSAPQFTIVDANSTQKVVANQEVADKIAAFIKLYASTYNLPLNRVEILPYTA